MNPLNYGDCFTSFPSQLRSSCTTSRDCCCDAEEKSEPAYLPAGLSSLRGGRCPGTVLMAVELKRTRLKALVSIEYQILL